MELWIRSQDREKLQRIDWIIYQDTKYNDGNCERGHYLCGGNDYNNEILSEYKTKERALEVLDEIQKFYQDNTNNVGTDNYFYSVYEMPKE